MAATTSWIAVGERKVFFKKNRFGPSDIIRWPILDSDSRPPSFSYDKHHLPHFAASAFASMVSAALRSPRTEKFLYALLDRGHHRCSRRGHGEEEGRRPPQIWRLTMRRKGRGIEGAGVEEGGTASSMAVGVGAGAS